MAKAVLISIRPEWVEITMECRNCDYYKAKNCKHQCMFYRLE